MLTARIWGEVKKRREWEGRGNLPFSLEPLNSLGNDWKACQLWHFPDHLPPRLLSFTWLDGDIQNPYWLSLQRARWFWRNRESFLYISFIFPGSLGRKFTVSSFWKKTIACRCSSFFKPFVLSNKSQTLLLLPPSGNFSPSLEKNRLLDSFLCGLNTRVLHFQLSAKWGAQLHTGKDRKGQRGDLVPQIKAKIVASMMFPSLFPWCFLSIWKVCNWFSHHFI